jgi:RND family efflux transporter MFP subunit
MRRNTWILCAACAPAVLALVGCGDSHAGSSEKPPPATVIVAAPVEKPIVDFIDYTGRTDAVESVEIRSRVTGFLDKVLFEDGTEVADGAPLYVIDDREFQADLQAAEAALAAAQAQQEKTTADLKRVTELRKKGAASSEELDRADANKKEADAAVQSAEAKKARAQLNVDFSRINAPLAGKISRTQIDAGNLVSANATLLTTIVSVDPIHVDFDVDERTMLELEKQVREGALESRKDREVAVLMGLTIDEGYPHAGKINFVENKVNPATGTIRARGVFDNPKPDHGNRPLTPGLFARIRIPIGRPHDALLVTDRAIGTDQGQKFVYVVDDKNEVVFRAIKPGAIHEGLREIVTGLKPGDRVIIDGLQRVRPGSTVNPKPGDMRSRPGGAARPEADAAQTAENAGSTAERRMTNATVDSGQ